MSTSKEVSEFLEKVTEAISRERQIHMHLKKSSPIDVCITSNPATTRSYYLY